MQNAAQWRHFCYLSLGVMLDAHTELAGVAFAGV
jgi:hypothetical protein